MSTAPNPVSPCCNAPTRYYDGALGYASFTCDKCGKDVADATPPTTYTAAELVKACRGILWPSGEPSKDRETEWTCDHLEALAAALELPTREPQEAAALAAAVAALKLFLEQYAHGPSPIEHAREQRPEVIAARAALALARELEPPHGWNCQACGLLNHHVGADCVDCHHPRNQ